MSNASNPAGTSASKAPKASAVMRFYQCVLPDLHSVMSKCDRPLYQWFETIPAGDRPANLSAEMARLYAAAVTAQQLEFERCEASHYATEATPETGVHLRVASKLDQGAVASSDSAKTGASGIKTKLSVAFSPSSAPQPPDQCPPIGFEMFNQVDQTGVNYYPRRTSVALSGTTPSNNRVTLATSGPWKDMYVCEVYLPADVNLQTLKLALSATAQISNPLVYDHWVRFKPIVTTPPPPPELLARAEPFALSAVAIDAPVEFYTGLPVGQRTQFWRVFADYSNADSGQVLYKEHLLEDTAGQVLPMGGYATSTELNFHTHDDEQSDPYVMLDTLDGTWTHRVCVRSFKKPSSQITVKYNGTPVYTGSSEIGTLFEAQYEPMVTEGIATVQETVTLRTVGLTKAAFRILGIEAVPGFGVRVTIAVINELHFAACIVTPFISGLSDSQPVPHFTTSLSWVVRNLPAQSESSPVSVLIPAVVYATGLWSLTVNNFLLNGAYSYAAESNKFPDGIYGTYRDASNTVAGLYPDINDPNLNGVRVPSGGPVQLLAAYAENGDRVMLDANYQAVELSKFPIYDALAGMSSGDYADSFSVTIEWQAEVPNPDDPGHPFATIGPRTDTLHLTVDEAVTRYGRYLTLPVANGYTVLKPTAPWTNGMDQLVTVYETWPGGDIHELETYLVDIRLRNYYSTPPWANFSYTLIRAPYLVVEGSWIATNPIVDAATNITKVRTLIEESPSASNVRVVLMG